MSNSTAEIGTLQTNSGVQSPTSKDSGGLQLVLPKPHQEESLIQKQAIQEAPDNGVHPQNAKLSDLNSLAEVGVGIALAFAVVERVRSYFKRYFEQKWMASHDEALSVILDVAPDSTNGQKEVVLGEFEIIQENYDKSEERMLKVQKWYSSLILFFLVLFLSGSPFYNIEISAYLGALGVFLIMSPILLASIYSYILYLWYDKKLSDAGNEIESLKDAKKKMQNLGYVISVPIPPADTPAAE